MPTLRDMTEADVPAVCGLMRELGYELTEGEVARRLHAVARHPDHLVVVLQSDEDGTVLAFLHVFERPAIEKPTEAVVQALVVTEAQRGGGLGRAMMDWVETWARQRGLASIALATHVDRAEAHIFYHRLGYHTTAESRLMRKPLPPE